MRVLMNYKPLENRRGRVWWRCQSREPSGRDRRVHEWCRWWPKHEPEPQNTTRETLSSTFTVAQKTTHSVTVATFNKPRTEQITSGMKQVSAFKSGHFARNKTINTILWLFKWIAVAPSVQAAREPIVSLPLYWNKHEWTSEGILFLLQKDVNTWFFKFKSTDVNLLSCLGGLSDDMADCGLWLVRSNFTLAPQRTFQCEEHFVDVTGSSWTQRCQ